jgi:hypothetical protein
MRVNRSIRKQAWRTLRVGERIRIVRVPIEFDQPGYFVARDTRRLFELLVQRARSHRIAWIDGWGLPYIDLRFRRFRGRRMYEYLGIWEDCWVRVRPRRASRKSPNPRGA